MYRTPLTELDLRIRAASAARAEHERLTRLRDSIMTDVKEAERHAEEQADTLEEEERDVARYQRGVWAFLYDVFADRQARLSREEREAAEAAALHQEAEATCRRLREEIAALGARIAALVGADGELQRALAAKEAEIRTGGGPAAEELGTIDRTLGALDAEIAGVQEALTAGATARMALHRLTEVLGSAGRWGTADLLTDSFLVSWIKRQKLDDAQGVAGAAQAALVMFRRELAETGVALDVEVGSLADHHRFLDTWFDNIFSDWSVQSRIQAAKETTTGVLSLVEGRIAELVARKQELDRRRADLDQRRAAALAPPDLDGQP